MTLEAQLPQENAAGNAVPRHVGIIMDGNGRWANGRGKLRLDGHRAGTEGIRPALHALHERGVAYVTLFAFSTENWGRPQDEVDGLLELLGAVIQSEVDALHRDNVRIRHLGVLDRLPRHLSDAICESVDRTCGNTGLNLCVAFDYGGRAELVDAVRSIVASGVSPEEVTEETIRQHLYLPDLPDPDLIIRTAGEQRISNFLIWQSAYSEYYKTDVLWPDFDAAEVDEALNEYSRRKRKFGLLPKDS
jgi:undecaprenyl diphosphate synthase